MKLNQIISTLVLLVVVGVGAFFGGTKYQQSKITSQFTQRTGANGEIGQGMGRNNTADTTVKNRGQVTGFRQTVGEIISADDKSVTVKLTDGSSKIILLSDSTVVNQTATASKTDLKVGTKVAVMGDTNTDGSITSKTIDINPVVPTTPKN
jgi:hypothetical protein